MLCPAVPQWVLGTEAWRRGVLVYWGLPPHLLTNSRPEMQSTALTVSPTAWAHSYQGRGMKMDTADSLTVLWSLLLITAPSQRVSFLLPDNQSPLNYVPLRWAATNWKRVRWEHWLLKYIKYSFPKQRGKRGEGRGRRPLAPGEQHLFDLRKELAERCLGVWKAHCFSFLPPM